MLIHRGITQADKHSKNVSLNGQVIDQINSVKFLGVMVNDTLTWNDHISLIERRITPKLNLLRHLPSFLPHATLS